jgi:hypothetical protein
MHQRHSRIYSWALAIYVNASETHSISSVVWLYFI